MVFSSIIFLFCFFPIVLFLYYVVCEKIIPEKVRVPFKNGVLLITSLVFYAYGEKLMIILLLASILYNYIFGLLIDRYRDRQQLKKLILVIDIVGNVGVFFIYKYLDFFITNVNGLFKCQIPLTGLQIPLGISFFTFQALSYVIDVYRGNAKVQRNPFYLGLYISLFPQLIAGPIVRYDTVALQIRERTESVDKFANGIRRFSIGLFKKSVLADTLAVIAVKYFDLVGGGEKISVLGAWVGLLAYSFELFFDFSGYSDMAIGLGKMFGFEFEENFNYPYISKSVSEFWRRWHISLSTWLKDYVYIPLGGNRKGTARKYLNLFITFFISGLWHGANWTYITWGVFLFIFIALEGMSGLGKKWKLPSAIGSIYALVTIVVSYVFFRSDSLMAAFHYIGSLFGIGITSVYDAKAMFYLRDNWVVFVLATAFSVPIGKRIEKNEKLFTTLCFIALLLSIVYIIKGGYSPFIYFNF